MHHHGDDGRNVLKGIDRAKDSSCNAFAKHFHEFFERGAHVRLHHAQRLRTSRHQESLPLHHLAMLRMGSEKIE
jgi:hypothetical protein